MVGLKVKQNDESFIQELVSMYFPNNVESEYILIDMLFK